MRAWATPSVEPCSLVWLCHGSENKHAVTQQCGKKINANFSHADVSCIYWELPQRISLVHAITQCFCYILHTFEIESWFENRAALKSSLIRLTRYDNVIHDHCIWCKKGGACMVSFSKLVHGRSRICIVLNMPYIRVS
jgi:hypothetical protein